MAQWQVKVLYDGKCPVCRHEVAWLKRRDTHGRLALEDISNPAFDPGHYGLSAAEVSGGLHGVLPDGRVVRRVEAIREMYGAVGLGWLAAPTGWPVFRGIADRLYRLFARHRAGLGRLVGRLDGPSCRCGAD